MLSEPNSPRTAAYQLPGGFTVEFTLDGARLGCAWSPDVPRPNRRLLRAYRGARGHFLRSVAAPGTKWGVLEI